MSKRTDRDEAIERLRGILKPGDTVFTILRHVSKSGMSRDIDLYKLEDGEPCYLSGLAALALGERRSKNDGIRVSGCGMDMGFSLVYNLSSLLYREGFLCLGESTQHSQRCPSNDHSNDGYGTVPKSERYSPARRHTSGGYALRHRWM